MAEGGGEAQGPGDGAGAYPARDAEGGAQEKAERGSEPKEPEGGAQEKAERGSEPKEPEGGAQEKAERGSEPKEPEGGAQDRNLPAVASGQISPGERGRDGRPARKSRAERRARHAEVAGRDCPIVVDATNHIAGRLASNVAKLLLGGNRVSIVNCERAMISGTRGNIVGEYKEFLEIASILHPKHGPFHPRRPDTIVSRMIRGMLPRKKPSGRAAHRRLRAYIGAPRELGAYRRVRFEKAMIKRAASGYTTMESLGDAVGWTR